MRSVLKIMTMSVAVLTLSGMASASPPTLGPPSKTLPPSVSKALQKCRTCHGKQLNGKKSVPNIAGIRRIRVHRALTSHTPKPMLPIVRRLSQEDKAAILKYIIKLPKPEAKPSK